MVFKVITLKCGYRLDLLADEPVIVEIKTVERIDPIHEAQLLTYLKLSGLCLGMFVNLMFLYLRAASEES